jgi:hypothetical protein
MCFAVSSMFSCYGLYCEVTLLMITMLTRVLDIHEVRKAFREDFVRMF